MDGFTRTRPNADRITCLNINETAEWRGELDECVLNYCPLDDLYDNVSKAFAQINGYGNAPNVSSLEQFIEQIPSRQKKVGIFYQSAELLFRCIEGYSFRDALQFKRTCEFFPSTFGFGRWQPANQSCTRMPFRNRIQ